MFINICAHHKRSNYLEYQIQGNVHERVNKIKNLGIIYDDELSFTGHIDFAISKAYYLVGSTKIVCNEFNDSLTLKCIYYAHVRWHFGLVMWYPQH